MASFPIVVDVMIKGLDQIKRLVETTKQAADVLDDAQKPLKEWPESSKKAGNASEEAGEKIKGAGKAAKQAGIDLERTATKFRAMGSAGTLAGDSLERLSIVTSGPLGAAIGAAVVGFAALQAGVAVFKATVDGLIASVNSYIKTSKPLQDAQGRLNQQFEDFKATLGAAITGGEGFAKVMDTVGGVISDLTNFIAENSDHILSFVKVAATVTATIAKVAVTGIMALFAPVTMTVDAAIKVMSELLAFAGRAQQSVIEFMMALPEAAIEAAGFSTKGLAAMYRQANRLAMTAGK